ncbi:MAG TPA: hypothetical protein DD640_07490 [Clostridiales bacterium]|nr:hypothetical protein [Clostridiales bacterium]
MYLKYYGPAYLAPTTCTTAETTAEEAFSPELAAAADSAGIQLNWTASPESRSLNYYKVVVSPTVAEPKYPDDGYLTYLCDRTANAYLINNSDAYQGGSFGDPPYLIPGESYYISITYVFNDGTKAYSTVRQVQYDGPAGP